MKWHKVLLLFFFVVFADGFVLNSDAKPSDNTSVSLNTFSGSMLEENKAADAFNGVYSECFLYFSFSCIQRKTLLYLQKLNELNEITVFGDLVKFVKLNSSEAKQTRAEDGGLETGRLSYKIDRAIDDFFDSHIIRCKALGRDITLPRTVDEFVGRKKRKGGGGGGGGGHDHGGGDDGGKKKMMMMAMMCMKMKFMMMVPAMMGMMGMMSFKGMMFSMMSFMMSKMMLLMKLLEKKGMGGGGDAAGWAAGGGGGGAWMPAGGQDYGGGGGGGGGGGYDANGQWQSRSIPENNYKYDEELTNFAPEISFVKPLVRYNNIIDDRKPKSLVKNLSNEVVNISNVNEQDLDKNIYQQVDYDVEMGNESKSRKKRGIMDLIQNAYIYWINRILGFRRYNKVNPLHQQQKHRIVNGVKYVYYPLKYANNVKKPIPQTSQPEIFTVKPEDGFKPITVEDFNKGEIVERTAESRMTKRKFDKFKDAVTTVVDDNPWE